MTDRRGRSGRPFERAKAIIKANATHCHKCGGTLCPEARWPNRWSTSIDHIIPLRMGGHPLNMNNLAAAHLHCNVKEGTNIRLRAEGKSKNPQSYTDDNW